MMLDAEAVKNITDKPLMRFCFNVDPMETMAALTSANRRWTRLGAKRLISLAIMWGGVVVLGLIASSGLYRDHFLIALLGLPADQGFAILFDAVLPMIFGFFIVSGINFRVMTKLRRAALASRLSGDEAMEMTVSATGLTMATNVIHYTLLWTGISDVSLNQNRIEFESGVRLLFIPLRAFKDTEDQQARFTEIREIWLSAVNKPV